MSLRAVSDNPLLARLRPGLLATAAVALLVTATVPAAADPARCASAIARSAEQHLEARSRALAECTDAALASGSGATTTDCASSPATAALLASLDAELAEEIADACGGPDGQCGNADDEALSDIGWDIGACPDLAGAGCNVVIEDCAGIGECLACTLAAATETPATYGDGGSDALLRCRRTLASASDRYLRAAARALHKCQAAVAAGRIDGPCPLPGDGRTAAKVAKAAVKLARSVCRSCGGADRGCDQNVLGISGSGGGDDVDANAIGMPATCPELTPPSSGISCGATIETLTDALACVQCSALFSAECAVTLASPSSADYPGACRGDADEECPGCMRWSDPATWGGTKPAAGEDVVIPAGWNVLLDEDTPALGGIMVNGTLRFDRKDVAMTARWMMVHGTLAVGTAEQPFEHEAVITLTGDDPDESIMDMGTRGIMVMGGALDLYGTAPSVPWTKIDAHAGAGATSLQLAETVDWNTGDQIVVAPTDWYGASQTERFTADAVAGEDVTLSAPLAAPRWGTLQYATVDGMSESAAGLVTAPEAETPLILDERAEVASLTRNIVVQAPDDALWQSQGFGVHVMIMGNGAQAHVEGVEFRRGGQRGILGRYPFHWHMLSYSGTQFLADTTGQFVRGSSVNESANRGIVIHGTNGVTVADNVIYDVRGHAVFTEDAVERRNTITGNLTLRVRNPLAEDALKLHEIHENGGSSGFWIANPDNTVTGNTAADSQGHGFWLAFPNNPWGASIGVPMRPSRMLFGTFEDNTAHTSGFEGLMFDRVEISNEGAIGDYQYISTIDGQDPTWNSGTARRFAITRLATWKNRRGGVWDRVYWPDFTGIVSADNCGRFFAGSGADGVIERSLIIGTSLNSATPRPSTHFPDTLGGDETPAAFATYHSAFDMRRNVVVSIPLVPGTRSGAFATEDYYLRPVDKGQFRNDGNLLIESHPGYRSLPVLDTYVLAGALWDPHGSWGPQGNWFVYDDPFFTYGLSVTPAVGGADAGGVTVPGPFYGILEPVLDNDRPYYSPLMALEATRLDPDTLAEVGTWSVEEAPAPGWLLAPMRHFAAHRDGIYRLQFPSSPVPQDVELRFENMLEDQDTLVLAVQFDGAVTPNAVYSIAYTSVRGYQEQASLQDVLDSGGETWWQDDANDLVWVKLRGGSWQFWDQTGMYDAPTSDELLYENTVLHIDTD
ncbi:MAG TPA: G8 domain-containing protein [Candidatus Binatia bacterium]|nr:G8 domain-containing protein [Candidatus Binatia bacterium]